MGAEFAEALAADRAGVLVDLVDERDVDIGADVGRPRLEGVTIHHLRRTANGLPVSDPGSHEPPTAHARASGNAVARAMPMPPARLLMIGREDASRFPNGSLAALTDSRSGGGGVDECSRLTQESGVSVREDLCLDVRLFKVVGWRARWATM